MGRHDGKMQCAGETSQWFSCDDFHVYADDKGQNATLVDDAAPIPHRQTDGMAVEIEEGPPRRR